MEPPPADDGVGVGVLCGAGDVDVHLLQLLPYSVGLLLLASWEEVLRQVQGHQKPTRMLELAPGQVEAHTLLIWPRTMLVLVR